MTKEDFEAIKVILEDCETNPDNTLFLYNVADSTSPFVKIPLGEDPKKDGFLVLHEDGWFIDYDE